MKIFLHEITDQETEIDVTQEEKWVADAVARIDEKLDGEPSRQIPQGRTAEVHFSLRKVDEVVVVSGRIKTYIQLVCSRCASPYPFHCPLSFSALFCKDPVMAGVGHLQRKGYGKAAEKTEARPVGQNRGFARHAHDDAADDDGMESGKNLDITYVSDDFVNLADVLSEQLQLQVPFQPLCQENCKGMCPQCGADLNVGRCACAKIATARPFSVLQDYKA